jgi:hypothetical protein
MTPSDFLTQAPKHLRRYQRRYSLRHWSVSVSVVKPGRLGSSNDFEVQISEPYGHAEILVSEAVFKNAEEASIWVMLEHEVQHIVFAPLNAYHALVTDTIESLLDSEDDEDSRSRDSSVRALRSLLEQEFIRTHERLRSALGRITGRGNNLQP